MQQKIRTFGLLLIALAVSNLSAQKDDTVFLEEVKGINRMSLELKREGNFQEGIDLLDSLMQELEPGIHDPYISLSQQNQSKLFMSLGEYEKSLELARKSLRYNIQTDDSLNMADNFNTIGINHYFLNRYDSTATYYETSLSIKKKLNTAPYDLAVSEYNLGILYEDLGDEAMAIQYYEAAEKDLLASGRKDSFLSDIYAGIAHIHFYSGDVEKAEFYSERAMDIGKELYGEDNYNMTFVYTSYANILEHKGKYQEAIELLEKSQAIRRANFGELHRWTCESYYDLANIHYVAGQYEEAENLYKKAIDIGQRIQSRQYLSYAKTYLARLYMTTDRNLDEAKEMLEASLNEKRDIFGPQNEVVAENYNLLAEIALMESDEKAFCRHILGAFEASAYQKDSLELVIAPFHAMDALELLGEWHKKAYQEDKDLEHLKKAFALLDEQLALVRLTQKSFYSEKSKIELSNEFRKIFDKGLDLCWQLYSEEKDEVYLEKAFDLSEHNRNSALLSGLEDQQIKLISNMPEDLLSAEKSIKADLETTKMDLYYEKSAESPDKEFLSELFAKRIRLTRSLDSLHLIMEQSNPSYARLKHQQSGIDLRDVQEALPEERQLIVYFLGEKMLYSFSISRDRVNFLRTEVAQKLSQDIEAFKTTLLEREQTSAVAQDLYGHLLKDQLMPGHTDLVVVADQVLNYIPFEILESEEGKFLLEEQEVSYNGSARLYLELRNDFFQYEDKGNWIGFAPSYERGMELGSSQEEVASISTMMSGPGLLGDQASKENFYNENKDHSIIHLAMHATIDNNNPLYNKLLFSDGELSASEIYLSNSQANMAVLSACNTGFGKIEKGEGVMNMARAFHFSGIPSVVMSLWKVPDRETKMLMESFYRHLKTGKSKSSALRAAKLDYLNTVSDPALRHPYYWSGFVVNGNSSTLMENQNMRLFALGIMAFGILGLTLYFRKKNKKNPKVTH